MKMTIRIKSRFAGWTALVLLGFSPSLALAQAINNYPPAVQAQSVIRDAATGKIQPTQLPSLTGIKFAPFISDGTLVTAIDSLTVGDDRQELAAREV